MNIHKKQVKALETRVKGYSSTVRGTTKPGSQNRKKGYTGLGRGR